MTDRVNVRRSHDLHLGVDNNYYIREIPTEKFLAPSVCIAQTVQSQLSVYLHVCPSVRHTPVRPGSVSVKTGEENRRSR